MTMNAQPIRQIAIRQAMLVWPLFACFAGTAQQTYESGGFENGSNLPINISGQLANTIKFSRVVEGSPFFWNDYVPGTLTTRDGKVYNRLELKLNLVDQELMYKTLKGEELVPALPMGSVLLDNPYTMRKAQFDFFDKTAQNAPWGWMLLLESGKQGKLYKRITKKVQETQPYGSASIEQHISDVDSYCIAINKQLIPVKKMEEAAALFPEKEKALLQFISTKKLKAKQEADWILLMQFVNQQ
jgi:hypothetical protein